MQTSSQLSSSSSRSLTPDAVFPSLRKHMLIDGFDVIIDFARSKGSSIVDLRTGKRYLDFFTFVASSPIGLNHSKLTTPEFLDRLGRVAVNKPSNSDIYTLEQAQFLNTFERVAMPPHLPFAFFVEGGALAVENALKASFDWKIRKNFAKGYKEERGTQILHFKQAFHGRSGYTLSLTNTDPAKTDLFPKFKWPRVLNPFLRFPMDQKNLDDVIKREEESIRQIKTAFTENKDDIAAIILEPIQGEGGDNQFRVEFFKALRHLADENDAMLIFDEVQTGVGMTGKMWAFEHYIQPDMITFGKKTQVCGFLCSKRIEEVPQNVFRVSSRINSTWGGNLVDMVRSQKYLEIIEEENLIENARAQGEYLLDQLNVLVNDFSSIISNGRGKGLYAAFDVNSADIRKMILRKCVENGLLILPSGSQSIRFRPALNITRQELDEGLDILRQVFKGI